MVCIGRLVTCDFEDSFAANLLSIICQSILSDNLLYWGINLVIRIGQLYEALRLTIPENSTIPTPTRLSDLT